MSTILPAMQKLLLDRGWNATTTPIVLGRYPAVPDTVLALRELVDIPGERFWQRQPTAPGVVRAAHDDSCRQRRWHCSRAQSRVGRLPPLGW
jgi:hypothetical protein